jgi:hypothetical protein
VRRFRITDFAAEEFRAISKKAQETGRYDLELIFQTSEKLNGKYGNSNTKVVLSNL